MKKITEIGKQDCRNLGDDEIFNLAYKLQSFDIDI